MNFTVAPDSFFRILVFNGELRGPEPSSMNLTPQNGTVIPDSLKASANQFAIEKNANDSEFELVVRNQTGMNYFIIAGHEYDYDANRHMLNFNGQLLLSPEFARQLGREAGSSVGTISVVTTVYPIETQKLSHEIGRASCRER